jgi:hypothetical protein
VIWQQEPDADLIAGNLVGQHLTDLSLQAFRIGRHGTLLFASALSLNKLRRVGGIKGIEFFLQAVISDDSFHAALADGMTLLADFLSDDFGAGIGVEEATADDQAHDLIGAAVIGFGPGFCRSKPSAPCS